jgi:uncharacterized protein YkwD
MLAIAKTTQGGRSARRAAVLGVGIAVLLAGAAPAGASCPDADLPPSAGDLNRVAGAMVCLINVERTHRGLVALRSNRQLHSSSDYHTRDMIASHFLAHQGPPPHPSLLTRIVTTGYFAHVVGGLFTENVGIGPLDTGTASGMVGAWMESDEHRANILRPEFRDVGIGARIAPADPVFYPDQPAAVFTTDFARRYFRTRPACRRSSSHDGSPSATKPSGYCSRRRRHR